MPRQALTRGQVLRRRRLVVLAGLLLLVLGASTLAVRAGQAAWAAVTGGNEADAGMAAPGVAREAQRAAGGDAPAWVEIDAVGVRHDLVAQGLTAEGTINPAEDEVIWFTGSDRAVPGLPGTAVIAGHVDYYSEPDAFATLSGVKVGDEVLIGQADGDLLRLTVRETATMSKEDLRTSDLVWSDQQDRKLVALITCDDALGRRADGHRAANFVALAEVTG